MLDKRRATSHDARMTKQTFTAFDTIRTSHAAYTHASRDYRWGVVRFHTSRTAAERTVGSFGDVETVRTATAADVAEAKAAKAAIKAERAARQAEFETAFRALGGR